MFFFREFLIRYLIPPPFSPFSPFALDSHIPSHILLPTTYYLIIDFLIFAIAVGIPLIVSTYKSRKENEEMLKEMRWVAEESRRAVQEVIEGSERIYASFKEGEEGVQ